MKKPTKKVRPERGPYLKSGGHAALNFINTCKKSSTGQHIDLLENYGDFLLWSERVGLIDWDMYMVLDLEQYCYAQEAKMVFAEVIALRNCLDEMFNNIAANEPVHLAVLQRFNIFADEIHTHQRYEMGSRYPRLFWHHIDEEIKLPLWLIVHGTVLLLADGKLDKIKKCPVCESLFFDFSRTGNRRWCTANTCGSLRKNKLYRLRKPAAKGLKPAVLVQQIDK